MNTPEEEIRFAEAFGELGEAAELMVEPPAVAAIRGKVRRRRTTRNALAAGLAAFLVAGPAAWWIQDSSGQEHTLPAGETSETGTGPVNSPSEGPTETSPESSAVETGESDNAPLPEFEDLVGTQMDLPPFTDFGQPVCPTDPATIVDGTPDWYALETWADTVPKGTPLLKVIHTPLREGGPMEAVALFECWQGDPQTRQAVVIAADGEGGWIAGEVLLGASDDDLGQLLDIAPAADYGVVMAMTTMGSAPDNPEHWYLLSRPNDDDPLQEVSDPGPNATITDLAITLEVVEGADGVWTAELSIANLGDQTSAPYFFGACGSESAGIVGIELADCQSDESPALEVRDGLESGERYEIDWTLDLPPTEEWNEDEQTWGVGLTVWVNALVYSGEGLIGDHEGDNNYSSAKISAADV